MGSCHRLVRSCTLSPLWHSEKSGTKAHENQTGLPPLVIQQGQQAQLSLHSLRTRNAYFCVADLWKHI